MTKNLTQDAPKWANFLAVNACGIRLTFEMAEEKKDTQYLQCKKDAKTLHDVRYFGGNANGFTEAINIVKQHQAESEVQDD